MTVIPRGDGSVLPLWVLNHTAELGVDLTEGSTAQTSMQGNENRIIAEETQ